jgi:hypothetical protein
MEPERSLADHSGRTKYLPPLEHGIVGSNPTQRMDVCFYSVFVSGSAALRWVNPQSKESLD